MKKFKNENEKIEMRLQFFAEEGDTDQVEDGGEDGDTGQEDGNSGEDEKIFTQDDLDDAIAKRLARERRKWKRQQEKARDSKEETDEKKVDKELQEKADRADVLETKILCYEQGVKKDAVNDVVALAKAYLNDDTDIEDAIEEVLEKYPQFKESDDEQDEDDPKPNITTKINGKQNKKKDTSMADIFRKANIRK